MAKKHKDGGLSLIWSLGQMYSEGSRTQLMKSKKSCNQSRQKQPESLWMHRSSGWVYQNVLIIWFKKDAFSRSLRKIRSSHTVASRRNKQSFTVDPSNGKVVPETQLKSLHWGHFDFMNHWNVVWSLKPCLSSSCAIGLFCVDVERLPIQQLKIW